eukprot:1331048-Pleurochrysis_carterae.AAC.1
MHCVPSSCGRCHALVARLDVIVPARSNYAACFEPASALHFAMRLLPASLIPLQGHHIAQGIKDEFFLNMALVVATCALPQASELNGRTLRLLSE